MRNRATRSYEYNAICDVCGFKKKASQLKKRWDGFMVCDKDFELRSPLDFYTTRNDVHLLPWTRVDVPGTDVSPRATDTNYALASNGSTASAINSYSGFAPDKAINGDLSGYGGGANSYWNNLTLGDFPVWLQVDFGQVRQIHSVVVYSRQDNLTSQLTPLEGDTSVRAVRDFSIAAWINNNWETVAVVSGNILVIKTVSFESVNTDKIRLTVYGCVGNGYTRVVELQAWGP